MPEEGAKGFSILAEDPSRLAASLEGVCGRFSSSLSDKQLLEAFDAVAEPQLAPARYNVAPGMLVRAVVSDQSGRHLRVLRWGLVPSWAKSPAVGYKMINARGETLASKPAFRRAFAQRRCVVPADAYYEWHRRAGPEGRVAKVPYAIVPKDGGLLVMAGLWERWEDRTRPEEPIWSLAVVTTRANDYLAGLHERMPVLLEGESWRAWLDPEAEPADLSGLVAPARDDYLVAYRVDERVNRASNDGPELLAPLPGGRWGG